MKARIKATGEVFEIASYATIPMECCDSFGNPLSFCLDDVEILSEGNGLKESEDPDYWTRLEHQYAGMAMQSYVSNNVYLREIREMCKEPQEMRDLIADLSILLATTLIQKLKVKEE